MNKSIFVNQGMVSPYRFASCTLRHWCTLGKCMSVCAACPHYTLSTNMDDLQGRRFLFKTNQGEA